MAPIYLTNRMRSRNPDAALGYGILRLTLGLDYLFHAATRWSHIGMFADKTVSQFAGTPLPAWSVRAFAVAITISEPIMRCFCSAFVRGMRWWQADYS